MLFILLLFSYSNAQVDSSKNDIRKELQRNKIPPQVRVKKMEIQSIDIIKKQIQDLKEKELKTAENNSP